MFGVGGGASKIRNHSSGRGRPIYTGNGLIVSGVCDSVLGAGLVALWAVFFRTRAWVCLLPNTGLGGCGPSPVPTGLRPKFPANTEINREFPEITRLRAGRGTERRHFSKA